MKTKVLLIGCKGNMGRRYAAIMNFHKIPFRGVDIGDKYKLSGYSHAIIATPIDTHFKLCQETVSSGIPTLCEKPISKDMDEVRQLERLSVAAQTPLYMVNNWWHIRCERYNRIVFDYYNTGNDGFWDLIQPVWYSKEFDFNNKCPIYYCFIDGFDINRINFDASYVDMIFAFTCDCTDELMRISEAVEAHKKVIAWGKKNKRFFK